MPTFLKNQRNFENDVLNLVRQTIIEHKRIIFNGNNYSGEWVAEAKRRGLLNLETTVDAIPCLISEKNIKLFTKHGVLSETELYSRYEILLENYCKVLSIEALTMIDMARKEIIPSVTSYIRQLSETAIAKKQILPGVNWDVEKELVSKLSSLCAELYRNIEFLDGALQKTKKYTDLLECAVFYKDTILKAMRKSRAVADQMELLTGIQHWPFPTFSDLLFSV